jgi:hypothetical protein
MPRFYISDGARPGRRTPSIDYGTKAPSVGSDILNEAQAIARGRKLTPTQGAQNGARYWRVVARSIIVGWDNPSANPKVWSLGELAMRNAVGVNLALTATPRASSEWTASGVPISTLNNGLTGQGGEYWGTAPAAGGDVRGEWIGYDFGAPVEITEIALHNYGNGGLYAVTAIDVEKSNDDATWALVESFTGLAVGSWSVTTLTIGGN